MRFFAVPEQREPGSVVEGRVAARSSVVPQGGDRQDRQENRRAPTTPLSEAIPQPTARLTNFGRHSGGSKGGHIHLSLLRNEMDV